MIATAEPEGHEAQRRRHVVPVAQHERDDPSEDRADRREDRLEADQARAFVVVAADDGHEGLVGHSHERVRGREDQHEGRGDPRLGTLRLVVW